VVFGISGVKKGFQGSELMRGRNLALCITALLILVGAATSDAPGAAPSPPTTVPATTPTAAEAPAKVDVTPVARDDQIKHRLTKILQATEWFESPKVDVHEGIVVLSGQTMSKDHKEWAAAMASKTEDVVAVVNRIEVEQSPVLDLTPAFAQIKELLGDAIRFSPLAVLSVLALAFTWFAAKATRRISGKVIGKRVHNTLLVDVAARILSVPVVLCGIYLALQISGLTRIALTVASAAGLAGLIIGIAFQGILENFLASILISIEHPFQVGDLIKIDDKLGFVQRVTTRGTVLMGYDGTYIQVPNSAMYKSAIYNFTANPKMRKDFSIAIGLKDSVEAAQRAAMQVLRDHPAVLKDPEPMVLVEEIVGANVNLRVYFWVDATQYSDLKVRSSVLRLVKTALQEAGVLPPVTEPATPCDAKKKTSERTHADGNSPVVTAAENGLRNEAQALHDQAKEAPLPEQGLNLLAQTKNGR
jgi:small conductance mechanosensitive channel